MLRRLAAAAWRTWRLKRDPVAWARSTGVRIGRDCRLLGVGVETFGSEPYLIELGDHVTITSGVRFITHDGGVWVFRQGEPDLDVLGPIRVGNNVFIGINTILLPGVTIGDDCVIGAGSVVTRDIPPGSVAAGVPARVIKSTAEYRAGLAGRESRIRNLPEHARRAILLERFGRRATGALP